jgi:outer membrane protein TolC
MSARRDLLALTLAWAGALGCAVGPNYARPEPPAVRTYTPEPAATPAPSAPRIETSGALAPDWWTLLRCRALDAVVADALAHSPNLEAAQAALRRSEEVLRAGHGVFFPQADLGAGAARQRYSPARVGSPGPGSSSISSRCLAR